MAAANTYTPIFTTTVSGSSTTDIVITSIPQTYTDLRLVVQSRTLGTNNNASYFTGSNTGIAYLRLYPNATSTTTFSGTYLYGNGSSAYSAKISGSNGAWYAGWQPNANFASGVFGVTTLDLFNYANTSVYKTVLGRSSIGGSSGMVMTGINLWQNTSAITQLDLYPDGGDAFAAGTIISLYGITAA